jgi:hypothetical protein
MLKFLKLITDWTTFSFGGGGGGGPNYTYSQTSNIPEYAAPYVQRMLGSTEKEIYTYGPSGDITNFRPFKPYAEYDIARGGTGETVAPFSPMQKRSIEGLANYQLPGQTRAASGMTVDLAGRAVQAGQYQPGDFQNVYNAPSPYQTGRFGVRDVGVGTFTRPGTAEAYMSPYQQAVTDIEKRELARQSAIEGQRQQAQAVQAGAFGGSRQGLVEAERQRNLMQQMSDVQARSSQNAFQQAREQFNAENLQAGLQAQLANQQAYQQAQQAREQSRQFGYGQGMTAAELGARYGLEGQRATEQSRQFGADLGLRGIEQARAAASQLGTLGQQQYQQELGLMGQQFEMGSKQQQFEQARLNQIIQDYATQQQYPFLQLSMLNNMLRGLPMQASTTQMYQAQPSFGQQAVGAAGTLAMMNQAMKAEGGAIKEMAGGGIASGVDPNELPDMMKKLSDAQLRSKLNPQETDPETLGIAQAEQQRRDQTRANMPRAASGGIVAFKDGDKVENPFKEGEEPPKKEASPVASRPKAAAPRPAADPSPYQTAFKALAAKPSAITPEISKLRALESAEEAEAKLTPDQLIARKQEAYSKYGIDPKQIYLNNKKDKEEALEAAKGDAERAQYLRWAQAFARFGSTPGPTLKAGLMALDSVLPDILEDQKAARAYQRELKTSIFELDKAELLREQGMVDEAFKQQQEARGRVAALSIKVGDLVAKQEDIDKKTSAELAGREITAQSQLQGDKIKAAAQAKGEERRLASEERRARESEAKQERQSKQSALQFYKDQTKGDKEQLDRLRNEMSIVTDSKEKEKRRVAIAEIEGRHRAIAAQAAATFNVDLSELMKSAEPPAAGEIKFTNPEAAEAFKQYK